MALTSNLVAGLQTAVSNINNNIASSSISSITKGVQTAVNNINANLGLTTTPANTPSGQDAAQDLRIRLAPLYPTDVYAGITAVLSTTNGMLFPYTPAITFTQSVNYMDVQLTHSNTDYPAYTRTPSVTIGINGKFTVQNQAEGRYALACLHFLRTVSKSYFGVSDGDRAGLPPPILVLSGYGNYMFGTGAPTAVGSNGLRVILKSHNWSFDDSADGIVVQVGSGSARLPALFTVSCELTVVQTPQRMRDEFSFRNFASGALMTGNNTGWI